MEMQDNGKRDSDLKSQGTHIHGELVDCYVDKELGGTRGNW